MKRYEEYKDTGIAWLPRIPAHWEERKFKYCFVERSEKNHPDEEMLCATQSHGVIPQSMYQNRVVVVNKGFEGLKLVKVGDFVISLRSFEGGIEYAYYQGIISAAYTVLTPVEKQCTEYFKRLFKSQPFIQLLQTCVTGIREGQNINYPLLRRKQIPIPPLAEQEKIVRFLEENTSKIDALLEEKGEQIQLLNELKESEIANIITQGLNPDVKMKDSRIPWLDSIPEHWGEERAKYLFNRENRPISDEDGIITCFRDGQVTLRKNRRTTGFTESFKECGYQGIRKGDLVIHQMDAFAGSVGISDSDGKGTPVYIVCTPKRDDVYNPYFALVIREMGLNGYIQSLYRGIRERSSDFKFDVFRQQCLPLPPIEEQIAIVSHIEGKVKKVNSLINELESEIEFLREYKQKLIADCVTGQINVQSEI